MLFFAINILIGSFILGSREASISAGASQKCNFELVLFFNLYNLKDIQICSPFLAMGFAFL